MGFLALESSVGAFALAAVSVEAPTFFEGSSALGWFTNSLLVAAVVVGLILFIASKATRNMTLVPHRMQNFMEYTVEFLYKQIEDIVGKKIAPKAFPLIATLFIYILIANWFGLLPGVGTIGFGDKSGPLTLDPAGHSISLLRPPTADLNLTVGIAIAFMLVWMFITLREVGLWGFLKHTFGPKGGMTGCIGLALIPIFLFVGFIEIVSIALRPVSLSFRLFGNIFAGENLLHTMLHMGDGAHPVIAFLASLLLPLPFYFLELLVGLLQAIVFALLCAVYIQLSTTHDEEGEGAH